MCIFFDFIKPLTSKYSFFISLKSYYEMVVSLNHGNEVREIYKEANKVKR